MELSGLMVELSKGLEAVFKVRGSGCISVNQGKNSLHLETMRLLTNVVLFVDMV